MSKWLAVIAHRSSKSDGSRRMVYPMIKVNNNQMDTSSKSYGDIDDGVNDALAMAVGGASDVATGAASVRLISSNTGGAMSVYHAHKIAKLTLKNIKQNLFFAFIYNSLGIPLAMMGVPNPMLASLAMALSSLSVLGNATRLAKVDLHKKTE